MCKYLVQIRTNFGNMSVQAGDSYIEAIDKYKEIKEHYKTIPCEISFYNKEKDDVQFTKINKEDSFDELYERLINTLADISRRQIEMRRKEKNYVEVRNELYHSLETTDISELSDKDQLDMLMNMKIQLNSRRLIEEENQKMYAFFKSFKSICSEIESYDKEKEKKLTHSSARFGNEYYTEDFSKKKNRTKGLLSSLVK
ncbi:MAG: hypothetical protein ACRCTZ_04350 [Sarcina sp.]